MTLTEATTAPILNGFRFIPAVTDGYPPILRPTAQQDAAMAEQAPIPAIMPTYGNPDLALVRGEGVWVYDTDNRRYLDFAGGLAVTILGHAHPHLVKALKSQADALWHTSNLYRIPEQERLARRLTDATFADTVFFCNSGAEAVEAGIKLIRRHFDAKGEPDRYRIITAESAFHGRTLTTISAAGQDKYLDGFRPEVDGFDHVPFGNMNALRAAIGPATAAILVEPVQGEGGVRPAPDGYLRQLREVADEFGLLLMFDEVQCGYGRSGRFFAHEWAGVAPDVMAVAKGIANGFPMGACLATADAARSMTAGTHGSTFGGNPLASAVANAVLDVVLADGFLAGVEKRAARFRGGLERLAAAHPAVWTGVRGSGLMLGLTCAVPNAGLVAASRAHGMLAAVAGDNVFRLLPPLIAEDEHFDHALDVLATVAKEAEAAAPPAGAAA